MTAVQAKKFEKPIPSPAVLAELSRLRGDKDLVVKRSNGSFDNGWQFPRDNQPYQNAGDSTFYVVLTKKESSFLSLFDESITKEVSVDELIFLNPPRFGWTFPGFGRPRPAGVAKAPVPVKREPRMMTEAELRAEIEYTFPHHASVAYGSLHAHLRRQQIRRYS